MADADVALLMMLLVAPRVVAVADAVHVALDARGSNSAVVAPVVDLQCKLILNFVPFVRHNDAVRNWPTAHGDRCLLLLSVGVYFCTLF